MDRSDELRVVEPDDCRAERHPTRCVPRPFPMGADDSSGERVPVIEGGAIVGVIGHTDLTAARLAHRVVPVGDEDVPVGALAPWDVLRSFLSNRNIRRAPPN